MAKVFLDVGAHIGQTLAAVLRWDFDRIVCFEPAKVNQLKLLEVADDRVVVEPFGLWNESDVRPLYNPGSDGASLWVRPNKPTTKETCIFVRVSDWLQSNIDDGDIVWMKLNVEGAELDIITDMLDSGAFDRINFLEVMWDAHKIPTIASRLSTVRDRIESLYPPPRVVSSKMVPPADTHAGRIDNWLTLTGSSLLKRRKWPRRISGSTTSSRR